jgi:hypothetical protein
LKARGFNLFALGALFGVLLTAGVGRYKANDQPTEVVTNHDWTWVKVENLVGVPTKGHDYSFGDMCSIMPGGVLEVQRKVDPWVVLEYTSPREPTEPECGRAGPFSA